MERDKKGQFVEGNEGRPPGARNKITTDIKMLVNKLIKAIEDAGIDGIVAESKADTLVNAITKLAPKDLNVTHEVKESRFLKAVEQANKERDG